MFRNLNRIIVALHRSRKPLPPEEQVVSEDRIWQAISTNLSHSTMSELPAQARVVGTPFSFRISFALFVVITLLLGTVWYGQYQQDHSQIAVKNTPEIMQEAQRAFLQSSASSGRNVSSANNASLGYVKIASLGKDSSSFITVAHAAESSLVPDTYTPAIFYTKNVDKHPQIFEYQTVSKTERQITVKNWSENPLFSSINQKLAFVNRPDDDINLPPSQHCNTVVLTLAGNSVDQEISHPDTCIQPVSWSPDGKNLLLTWDAREFHPLDVESAKELKGKISLAIYSTDTQKVKHLESPSSELTTTLGGGSWVSNSAFVTVYTKQSEPLENSQQVYKVSITGAFEKIATEYPFASVYKEVKDSGFYISTDSEAGNQPVLIAKKLGAVENGTKVPHTTSLVNYLLQQDEEGNATGVVIARGDNRYIPGDGGRGGMFLIPLNSPDAVSSVSTSGNSSLSLIGWLNDYQHMVYQYYNPQGELAVHVYDFATETDEKLI